MAPTGRLKSRKSALGTRSCLGIEPVRLILPPASVKSRLGRTLKKNDVQKQTPPKPSSCFQSGEHNAKKCLFSVNKENQEQSGTVHHDSYEDISGIHEIVNTGSCQKKSYSVNKSKTARETSSILTLRQEFVRKNDVNVINTNDLQPLHSPVYTNSVKHHYDERQLLTFHDFLFPSNRAGRSPEDTFVNRNHEINPKGKLTSKLSNDCENLTPDIKRIRNNNISKRHINICKKAADFTPVNDTDLPNHLIIDKNCSNKIITEPMTCSKNITEPDLLLSSTKYTVTSKVNSPKDSNNDSIMSFKINELTNISNDSDTGSIKENKLVICDEASRNERETDFITESVNYQKDVCNSASHSKPQLQTEQQQTRAMQNENLLTPEKCVNTTKHVEAVLAVIESTQSCIQSLEKNIVEQLRKSMRQLDIIKNDLTNSVKESNRCSYQCVRNKILNIPSDLNGIRNDVKEMLQQNGLQAKNLSTLKDTEIEVFKNSLESVNEFDESGYSQFESKCEEESTNHSNRHDVLPSSLPYYNRHENTMQAVSNEDTSGSKMFVVKNVTFKIPRRTPVSSRKRTKLYSNYKSHYNTCVKTPESSCAKIRKQMNMSLVLTPHSMSNRLSTQIEDLFES